VSFERLPLRFKLPSLIATLLAFGVVAFAVMAFRTVRSSLLATTEVRLATTSREVAQTLQVGLVKSVAALQKVAAKPEIVAQLHAGAGRTLPAARTAMEQLSKPGGTVLAVELRDSTGRTVLALASPDTGVAAPDASRPPATRGDTASIGRLFMRGDQVAFEVRANVVSDGHVIGQLVDVATTSSRNGSGVKTINQLVGADGAILLGNADGTQWTDFKRAIHRPPPTRGLAQYTREGRARVAASAPIGGTPWVLGFELSADSALAPLHTLERDFSGVALVVLLLGLLLAWSLSRSITSPLAELTIAAEAISAGDLDHPPPVTRREDEIGRLSRSFVAMAGNVRAARDNLEHQIAERTAQLREAQAENVRQERLATLGQLSSSVGHELRNPLGVMSNAVYFLNATLADSGPKTTEYLGILKSQIALSEKIVADLLDFARVKPPQRERVSMSAIVDEQLKRVTLPPTVQMDRMRMDDPRALVDPVQIGQVVLNLLTNAMQAMEDSGGTLQIRTEAQNGSVRLSVRDTGPGIPSENLAKVFEPLFTTKARGIGLGLSVSRSLARANDGDLAVTSIVGQGATFTLDVPASK